MGIKEDDINDQDEVVALTGYIDPYQHVSSYLQNITQYPIGRQFLLQKSITTTNDNANNILPTYMQSILNQMRTSKNPLRRRNCAGIIKNICMDVSAENSKIQSWFLTKQKATSVNDDLIFNLLYPFVTSDATLIEEGEDEYLQVLLEDFYEMMSNDHDEYSSGIPMEKIREPCWETRLLLTDTILLLCTHSRSIREILRSRGMYYILRYADLMEEREEISDRILDCVQL